jgi:WD40 repeat protein
MGLKEHTLKGHAAPVTSAIFSHDGSQLFTASDDGELRIWDTARWRCQQTIATGRTGGFRLARSTDGALLAGIWRSPGPAVIWSTRRFEEHLKLALRPEEMSEDYDLAFSPDGAFLTVLSENLLRIWDLSSCQVAVAIDAAGFQSCAYSPDGRVLATAGAELRTRFEVQLWDVLTGDPLAALSGQHEGLRTICFSPQGGQLACAGRDLLVHLWEL